MNQVRISGNLFANQTQGFRFGGSANTSGFRLTTRCLNCSIGSTTRLCPRTFSGMIARLFNARTSAAANLVPYASVGVGMQDLLGGHVDAMVADLASTAALARQGKLRVLATTSAQRVNGWEQVPSLAEKLPGFDMVGWFAIVAPAGTPVAAIERANRDVNALLSDKEVAERIGAIGPIADVSMNVEAVGAFLRAESARWTVVTREIGVLPE